MALTQADLDKKYYRRCLAEGMTHKQIINSVHETNRQQFIENIQMSDTEAHFGVSSTMLLICTSLLISLFLALIIVFLLA